MCMSGLSQLWSPDEVYVPPTQTVTLTDTKEPSKTSEETQAATEEERRKRANSTQGLSALTRLTGGLGDADFTSVNRVTLG